MVLSFPTTLEISTAPNLLDGMAICLVGINYAPDSTGIAPYNEAMAKAFRDAGAVVHVVTGIPHYPQWRITDERYRRGTRWDEVHDGIRVTRVRHHVPLRSNLKGRAQMEASFLARALPVVRADRSNIVIAVTPSLAGLAAGALGKRNRPLGVLVQDLTGNAAGESGTTGGRASSAIAALEYSLLRTADLVGVITPQFGTILTEHGISRNALRDLPNFTHIVPVQRTQHDARERLGWAQDRFTVVHTGNMGMKQGLETIVEAARISEHEQLGIDFVLVGEGNQRTTLQEAGASLSTLKFVDPLSGADYPFALAAADALLVNERPGVKEMSLPSKLTSYTSADRPIIAAVEEGGITHSQISGDGAAFIVEPGKPREVIRAAITLRDDPSLAATLSEAAKGMFEKRYSPTPAKARYVAFALALKGEK